MGGICSSSAQVAPLDSSQGTKPRSGGSGGAAGQNGAAKQDNADSTGGAQVAAVSDDEKEDSDEEADEDTDSDLDDFDTYERVVNPKNLDNTSDLDEADFGIRTKSEQELKEDDLFQLDDADEKVEFTAVKPWKGAIKAPSNAPAADSSLPEQNIELEWAYGYTSKDMRMNLFVDGSGNLVYPAAGLGVIYNPTSNTQRFFQGHNDDLSCLAQHPSNPNIFVSGQVATIDKRRAQLPRICVWNSETGQELCKITKAHRRAVRSVGFSASGKLLASVGADNDFTLCIWDWEDGRRLASSGTEKLPNSVFQVMWKDDETLVTVGKKHVFFWTYKDGMLKKKRGSTAKRGFKRQTFVSVDWTKTGKAAVACRDGSVYIFNNNKAVAKKEAHKKTCLSILKWEVGDASGLISGGKDGRVCVWSSKFDLIQEIDVKSRVSAIACQGGDMFVGTTDGKIGRIANFQQAPSSVEWLLHSHSDGELWGLDVHPDDKTDRFVTVGEDNKLILWDSAERRAIKVATIDEKPGKRRRRRRAATTSAFPTNQCARGVAFSPDGAHIAVGTNEGHLLVFQALDLEKAHDIDLNSFAKQKIASKKTGNWISALKYSPNGKFLAVGTHGSVIVLIDVDNGYKAKASLNAHAAAISHLDWSEDSKHIQSNCIAYELLFHDIDEKDLTESAQQPNASLLRDTKWATQTCRLGWPVQGIYAPDQDGTDVNAVDRSPDHKLLASGDDYGFVNVFRYPVSEQGAEKFVHRGHSAHVQNVRFSRDGTRLISVGGGDQTVLQWTVKDV